MRFPYLVYSFTFIRLIAPPQPAAPSAEIHALRTNWKWAYLSHFLFTYNPVLHLEDIQLSVRFSPSLSARENAQKHATIASHINLTHPAGARGRPGFRDIRSNTHRYATASHESYAARQTHDVRYHFMIYVQCQLLTPSGYSLDNWQQQLRKQSLKRSPDHNLMGPEEDPTDFASLIMSDKLDLFHALCEWQFHNPNNLRARMRDDDEYANWVLTLL